jgi:hypothetical protein
VAANPRYQKPYRFDVAERDRSRMENASEHPRVFVRDPGKDCPPSTGPWYGYMLDKVSCQFQQYTGEQM